MKEVFERSVNGMYQTHTIKQNREVEITFCFGTEMMEDILSLLSNGLGVYGELKVTKNSAQKEMGEYKVYQGRLFETGESTVTFRSNLGRAKAENISFLSPQKSKVKLEFRIKD